MSKKSKVALSRKMLLVSKNVENFISKYFVVVLLFFSLTTYAENHSTGLNKATLVESPLQEVTTLANSGIIPGTKKYGADGISVDKNGDMNEIKQVTPDGVVSTFASGLDGPAGVYVDGDNNVIVGLYGAKYSGKAATVLRITPNGVSSVLAQGNGLMDVIGVVGDENGEIYAGNYKGRQLYKVSNGDVELLATSSVKINMIDYSHGYIYIANDGRIVRINTSTGEEELFSGTPEPKTVNGPVESADFVLPTSLAFSFDGKILYVVDQTTGDIRKIAPKK